MISRLVSLHLAALACLMAFATAAPAVAADDEQDGKWIPLFNGKNLDGWTPCENPDSFKVVDGELVVKGERGHLFYTGDVSKGDFKDFEWKCEIMTKPNANSGMYFHTKVQRRGWPGTGYEVQVNQTHPDPRKTGGLYGIVDVMDESPVKDNEWYTQHVIVKGKRIIIKVNGKTTVDYTEPDELPKAQADSNRRLSHGTFAIQAHDPGSEVHYRKIDVKLP